MEPGIRKYLTRILNTLGIGLLWMAINSTAGIMFGYGLVEDSFRLGNVIFYTWFFLSMLLFSWWVYRIWRTPITYED
ncbi:MAG: hypothetical protein ACK5GV_07750 [Bacteroidota bacterium]